MRLGLRYTELEADKSAYRDKKVVLLVRDVKDTLTSAYFQATRRLGVFQGPISEFIRSDVYGSRKLLTFYQQWFQAPETPKELLVIRYEQIHEDALSILRFVIEFIGFVAVPQEILESAVAFSGFRNLRQMEAQNHFRSSVLAPGDPADPQSFKLRQGKLGSYREHFSDSDISYVDSEIARFGCAFTIPEKALGALWLRFPIATGLPCRGHCSVGGRRGCSWKLRFEGWIAHREINLQYLSVGPLR